MNSNNFADVMSQGFRISVGAATSFLETIQDPQKRAVALSDLQTQLQERTREWSEKGELTELEARRLIEEWLQQQQNKDQNKDTDSNNTATTTKTSASQINELTEQIIALRTELEKLRNSPEN